jgi:hypothetical protein
MKRGGRGGREFYFSHKEHKTQKMDLFESPVAPLGEVKAETLKS